MTLLLVIEHKGYTVEAHQDTYTENPLEDSDLQPVIVLHRERERRYGFTTDKVWGARLNNAFDHLVESKVTRTLRGPDGALAIIDRWLRVFHKTRSFPIGLFDHSGVIVYLGADPHIGDYGGWDSGWAGWILFNAEMAQWPDITDDQLDANMLAAFAEYACWVSGDVFGYTITAPDGEREVGSCWGFFGLDNLSESDGWLRKEVEATIDLDIAAWAEA